MDSEELNQTMIKNNVLSSNLIFFQLKFNSQKDCLIIEKNQRIDWVSIYGRFSGNHSWEMLIEEFFIKEYDPFEIKIQIHKSLIVLEKCVINLSVEKNNYQLAFKFDPEAKSEDDLKNMKVVSPVQIKTAKNNINPSEQIQQKTIKFAYDPYRKTNTTKRLKSLMLQQKQNRFDEPSFVSNRFDKNIFENGLNYAASNNPYVGNKNEHVDENCVPDSKMFTFLDETDEIEKVKTMPVEKIDDDHPKFVDKQNQKISFKKQQKIDFIGKKMQVFENPQFQIFQSKRVKNDHFYYCDLCKISTKTCILKFFDCQHQICSSCFENKQFENNICFICQSLNIKIVFFLDKNQQLEINYQKLCDLKKEQKSIKVENEEINKTTTDKNNNSTIILKNNDNRCFTCSKNLIDKNLIDKNSQKTENLLSFEKITFCSDCFLLILIKSETDIIFKQESEKNDQKTNIVIQNSISIDLFLAQKKIDELIFNLNEEMIKLENENIKRVVNSTDFDDKNILQNENSNSNNLENKKTEIGSKIQENDNFENGKKMNYFEDPFLNDCRIFDKTAEFDLKQEENLVNNILNYFSDFEENEKENSEKNDHAKKVGLEENIDFDKLYDFLTENEENPQLNENLGFDKKIGDCQEYYDFQENDWMGHRKNRRAEQFENI